VVLATRGDKTIVEGLGAGLSLLELSAQRVGVVIVRRSGGFRGLRRRGIVKSLDSLVHGLLLVVGEQFGEVRAGNGESCQYTVAVAGDATLEGGSVREGRCGLAVEVLLQDLADSCVGAGETERERDRQRQRKTERSFIEIKKSPLLAPSSHHPLLPAPQG
jgi:hypothetical protein